MNTPLHFSYIFGVQIILFLGVVSCSNSSGKKPDVRTLFEKSLKESRVLNKGPGEQTAEKYSAAGKGRDDTSNSASTEEKPDDTSKSTSESGPFSGRGEPTGPKVSSTFTQTDIRQAIETIATKADTSVTIGPQVQGVVSAVIQNEPFEAALQRILITRGLVYREVDGRYFVGAPSPSSSLFSTIAIRDRYTVQNMPPEKLLNLIPKRYQKFLQASNQQQAILIEAPRRLAREIRSRLKEADHPVKQVVIEAIVAVFSPDTRFRFGLNFEQGIRVHGDEFINLTMEELELTGQYGPPQFSSLRNFSFTSTFLRALAEEGYLTIRAAPRVMARAGEEAKIRIGRQTFFSTQPQPEDSDFFIRQELEEVQSGIVLKMEPLVRGDRVVINLKNAEVSEQIRTSQRAIPLNTQFPVINRREVSTRVAVQDGQTIVIGGLVQKTRINEHAEIPYLSDVPGLGQLFERQERQRNAREVAVFLSPRIVEK